MPNVAIGVGVIANDNPTSAQIVSALGYTPLRGFSGSAAPVANGATTTFNIAHGLGRPPTYANAIAKNDLTAGIFSQTWDATNIIVKYLIAPASGTLSFTWFAF